MEFHPHEYQRHCIERILEQPFIGLFLEMGLGKTAITLTAIDELRYNRLEIRKTLVVAPLKVAEATWTDEAAQWEHTKHLRINLVLGSAASRKAALARQGDIWVINRENVVWLVDYLGADWDFDCLVLDELSSFKNPSAKRFKALRKVRSKIKRVIGLTGTPAPNGYEDLWSQIYLLDQGERLYPTVTAYRERYFTYNPWSFERKAKDGSKEAIDEKIKDICISMESKDYLQLPELVINNIPVQLSAKSKQKYDQMEREAILAIESEEGVDTISAMSAATLTNKLLQLCGGSAYDEDGKPIEIHTDKMDAFLELLDGLQGRPAIVFYGYKHEKARILEALTKRKGLRVRELQTPQDQKDWNKGEVDVLLAHPASTAYGLNLQKGGNHIVWYTLSWSLELYQQANARLHRQGQSEAVIIHRLLVKGGVDEDVARALTDKTDTQAALMQSLKARIEKQKGLTQ